MASRVISIKVVYENREALVAARAQAIANKAVADAARASALAAQKLATEEQKTAKASAQAALAQQKLASSLQQTKDKADSQSRSFASLIAYTAKLYGSFQLVSKTVGLVSNEMRLAFSSAYKLQQSMTLLGAAGNLTADQMVAIRANIHSLSAAFPVAQEEVAKGALELTRMGYTGKELENVLGAVTKASVIMGTSVEDTGQAVFTASNIFGYASSQADEVAAKLTYAANASALSLQQIGVALNYTAGTAKTAGVALDPVLAMMATLRNLGVGASTIGTSMRTFFRELSAGGKAVKAIGGDINSLGLSETLERFSKLDPRTFANLFSKPASSALQLFQADLRKTNSEFMELWGNIGGDAAKKSAEDAASRFGQDLPGAIQKFQNALTTFADGLLSGKTGEALTFLVNKLTEATNLLGAVTGVTHGGGLHPGMSPEELAAQFDVPGFANPIRKTANAVNPGSFTVPSGYNPTSGTYDTSGADEIAANAEKQKKAIEDLEKAYKAWQLQIENMELKGHAQDVDLTKKQYLDYAKQFEKLGEIGSANAALREHNSLIKDQEKALTQAEKATEALMRQQKALADAARAASAKQAAEDLRALQINLEALGSTLAGPEWATLSQLQVDLAGLSAYYGTLGQEDKVAQIQQLAVAMEELRNNSTFSGKFVQWGNQLKEFSLEAEAAKTLIGGLESGVQQLSEGLANNLVGAIGGVKTATVDFGEIFKGVMIQLVAQMTQVLIRMAAMRLALAVFGGPVAAAPIGDFGVSAFSNVAASGMTKTVRQPTPFLAGESGKETVTITPRARVNRANSGGDIVVNINGDVYGAEKFNEAVAVANKRKAYV